MVQADQFVPMSGISYRQLDTWTRKGYLEAEGAGGGSGRAREWSMDELVIARRIKTLLAAGFVLAVAADLARKNDGEHDLVDGVSVNLAFTA